MFYFCFLCLSTLVFIEWKKQDLGLKAIHTETKALSRSLAGSNGSPDWLQDFILDFELAGFSYLPFLASLCELGEEIRFENRKLLTCYGAKSCNILVVFVVMNSLKVESNFYFCLVILIFSSLSLYSLGFKNRRQILDKLKEFERPLEIDFSSVKEVNSKTFKRKYSTVSALGTMAELAVFLVGMVGASHTI
jgi:hypothetical protein